MLSRASRYVALFRGVFSVMLRFRYVFFALQGLFTFRFRVASRFNVAILRCKAFLRDVIYAAGRFTLRFCVMVRFFVTFFVLCRVFAPCFCDMSCFGVVFLRGVTFLLHFLSQSTHCIWLHVV